MNANAFHNILNIVFLMVGVLVTADYSMFGWDAAFTAKIVGGLIIFQNLLKIIVNIGRDGVDGLFKEQPPVEK